MVDYSKWDHLELSDDSDVEVHPNVDKKSFIRWKQRDIHEKRAQRKAQIEDLKASQEVNTNLQIQVDEIITRLMMGGNTVDEAYIFNAFRPKPELEAHPAPTGEGGPTYAQMLSSLFEEIKKDVAGDSDKKEAYLRQLAIHRENLKNEMVKNADELAKLEKEERNKITSEGLHEGFSTSYVSKSKSTTKSNKSTKPLPTSKTPKAPTYTSRIQAIEVLNPEKSSIVSPAPTISSGAEADSEPESEDGVNAEHAAGDDENFDEQDIHPSELGKRFGEIKISDLSKSMNFIIDNPDVVSERNTDGLLVYAFNAHMEGKEGLGKQYVHQGLLLQYVRQVGRNGVKVFFQGIANPQHKAYQVFNDDITSTNNRIRTRSRELAAERLGRPSEASGGVEQIQLQAVDPSTEIHISIPPSNSEDTGIQQARKIFEAFPPGLQRALERGRLEDINVVLGKMAVDEAEEIVGLLGQGGMLSIEPKIVDMTKEDSEIPKELQRPPVTASAVEEID